MVITQSDYYGGKNITTDPSLRKKDRVKNSIAHYLRPKILNKFQHIQTKQKRKKKNTTTLKKCLNEDTSLNSNLALHSNVSL